MKKYILIFVLVLLSTSSFASKIHNLDWNGLDVVWIEDDRFPTYYASVYYADGLLGDSKKTIGASENSLSMLFSGTRRFSRKEISENLEYFGVSHGSSVHHEYSAMAFSGLVKDIIPTVKKVCHVVDDAVYPKKEWKIAKRRYFDSFKNLGAAHDAIANRVFREVTLGGSDAGTSSKRHNVKRISRKDLIKSKNYYQSKVYKKLFITGPKEVLAIQNIINNECGWKNQQNLFKRRITSKQKIEKNKFKIFLVPVKGTNQGIIKIGRGLTESDLGKQIPASLAADYLAGGDLSVLNDELREKRGLTYGVGSYISFQRDYGRVGISVKTKNETVVEVINLIKKELDTDSIDSVRLSKVRKSLAGSYPFSIESNTSYLSQLLFTDHLGKSYDSLYNYSKNVLDTTDEEVFNSFKKYYNWDDLTIVVTGDKSLLKSLKKLGPVKVVDYNKYF